MFLFIFTSLSEIGLFYYKPKDIFCQHKNNYLRRVAAPDHIASVILPSFQENKKQQTLSVASISQRQVTVRSYYICFLPSFQKTPKQRIIPHCFHSTAASCRSRSYCLCFPPSFQKTPKQRITLPRLNRPAAS